MDAWALWLVAAIVLFIAEMLAPGVVLACFAVGALAAAVVSLATPDLSLQIVAFAVVTFVAFAGMRPFVLKYLFARSHQIRTNVAALVGRTGRVSEAIDPESNRGRVLVGGEDWRSVSVDERKIDAGEKVTVVRVEGTRLFVKPVSKRKE